MTWRFTPSTCFPIRRCVRGSRPTRTGPRSRSSISAALSSAAATSFASCTRPVNSPASSLVAFPRSRPKSCHDRSNRGRRRAWTERDRCPMTLPTPQLSLLRMAKRPVRAPMSCRPVRVATHSVFRSARRQKRAQMKKTLTAALIALAPALAACDPSQSKPQDAPPPPQVTVAKPVAKMIADHDEYVGRFVAVESVQVRARVSGYLDEIHFQDGQIAKKGDLLFTIDRRPFETALAQAQASLAQARANLAFAESDLARGQGLAVGSVITQQTLDQRTQAKRVAQAAVAAQEAAVEQAELDLEFTELRAPVSGRIGDRRVSIGNLVTGGTSGNTSLLATIESIDPIRFEFTVDEASYLRYTHLSNGGAEAADRGLTVPIKLKLIGESAFSHEGKIDFVDNAIDRSTGTIRARAVFSNPKGQFTPGMFARVQMA